MNLEEQLAQCLSSYAMDGLYTIGGIPPDKLTNAIQNFPIDARDTVLALIDATVMGSCKKGMAFGLRGTYWKNDWTTKTQRNFMTWEELSSIAHLIGSKSFDVSLGPGNLCNLSGSNVKPAQATNLLNQLINVYNDFKVAGHGIEAQRPTPETETAAITIVASSSVPLQLTAPLLPITSDRYAQGVAKAFAVMVCADGELDEAQIELAIQFLEADDAVPDKAAAIEAMTGLVEELLGEYTKSRPLFKLKCSKLIAQIRDEIAGPPREHVRVMLGELADQAQATESTARNEVNAKLTMALAG